MRGNFKQAATSRIVIDTLSGSGKYTFYMREKETVDGRFLPSRTIWFSIPEIVADKNALPFADMLAEMADRIRQGAEAIQEEQKNIKEIEA